MLANGTSLEGDTLGGLGNAVLPHNPGTLMLYVPGHNALQPLHGCSHPASLFREYYDSSTCKLKVGFKNNPYNTDSPGRPCSGTH